MERFNDDSTQHMRTANADYAQRIARWRTANPDCEWTHQLNSCLSTVWAHREGFGHGLAPDQMCPDCRSKL
jgi:hypothetical protein